MKISEVSAQLQMSADTLRYYEKIGLIGPIEKRQNIRHFKQSDIDQLNFIRCMKRSGMELETILHFLALYRQGEQTLPERIDLLAVQKAQTMQKLQELQETLDYLDFKMTLYQDQLSATEPIN
ncbi:MAG: MerR family transcriptional regulator [Culicoidibacterales bacterium]